MKHLLRNFAFTSGAMLTLALLLVALTAPLIAPYDPDVQDTSRRLEPPSKEHLFGLDELGRDELSRVVWGARVSLRVGFSVVILASLVGVSLGAISGYSGRWFYTIIIRITDIFPALPGRLLAVAMGAVLRPNVKNGGKLRVSPAQGGY